MRLILLCTFSTQLFSTDLLSQAAAFLKDPDSRISEQDFSDGYGQILSGPNSERLTDLLIREIFSDSRAENLKAFLPEIASHATQEGLEFMGKFVFSLDYARESLKAIAVAIRRADTGRKTTRRILRYRLARPSESDFTNPSFVILLKAAQIADKAERKAFLRKYEKWVENPNEEGCDLMDQKLVEAPAGYILLKRFIGAGSTGIVHLVERASDRKKFAYKIPNDRSAHVLNQFADEISDIAKWKVAGFTTMDVFWDSPKKIGLLKTFIDGPTLRDVLVQDAVFFRRKSDRRFLALAAFLGRSIAKGMYLVRLNADNLIYRDQKNVWEMIDGDELEDFPPAIAREKYQKSLVEEWSRAVWGLGHLKNDVAMFVASCEGGFK